MAFKPPLELSRLKEETYFASFIGLNDRGAQGLAGGASIIVIGGVERMIWPIEVGEVVQRVPPFSSFLAQGCAVDM